MTDTETELTRENRKRTYTWNGSTHPITLPQASDYEMAGGVRMLMRDQLNHEAVCCAARDRIMCLAAERDAMASELSRLKAENEAYAEMEIASAETGVLKTHMERRRTLLAVQDERDTLQAELSSLKDLYRATKAILAERDDRLATTEAKLTVAVTALITISVRLELTGDELQKTARKALSEIGGAG